MEPGPGDRRLAPRPCPAAPWHSVNGLRQPDPHSYFAGKIKTCFYDIKEKFMFIYLLTVLCSFRLLLLHVYIRISLRREDLNFVKIFLIFDDKTIRYIEDK